jgi:hypothetical protein
VRIRNLALYGCVYSSDFLRFLEVLGRNKDRKHGGEMETTESGEIIVKDCAT